MKLVLLPGSTEFSPGPAITATGGGRVVLLHTEVEPDFDGRGIGSALAKLALENARQQGEMVVPLCPFVESYIERHEEYADLFDEDMFRQLRS